MRFKILLLWFLPALFSCSGQEELTESSTGAEKDIAAKTTRVVFKSAPQPQCVYIFRQEGNVFRYNSMLNSGWSDNGTMTTRLLTGNYKFICTGPLNGQLDVLPTTLDSTISPEQLHFASKTDDKNPNAILPAEELFLPEPDIADSVYSIHGEDEIKCVLKRRVSQLEFILKRGYKEKNEYIIQPYSDGHNILETISELHVEISGVACECNYLTTSGKGTILCDYTTASDQNIDTHGFAKFTGPFVFPPSSNKPINLLVKLVSTSGKSYPTLQLSGKLEANRKLEVNLWLNSSYFDIGVTINNLPISDRTNGDEGIWK